MTTKQQTETYTGIDVAAVAAQSTNIVCPPPMPKLPPLVPFAAKVTMDTTARLPSTWRTAIGKPLTNAKITEYQREGRYGSGLKLPPAKEAKVCCIRGCNSKINTKLCGFDYLPTRGIYCKVHRDKYRAIRDEARERAKRERELEQQLFANEYV